MVNKQNSYWMEYIFDEKIEQKVCGNITQSIGTRNRNKHTKVIGREKQTMATSTFKRKIVISNPESLQRLERVMYDQTPKKPISEHPFSSEDRKRGEALLKRCKLCSPR